MMTVENLMLVCYPECGPECCEVLPWLQQHPDVGCLTKMAMIYYFWQNVSATQRIAR